MFYDATASNLGSAMTRTRIYRAALALDNFTIGELAAHCGANTNTVRNLITTRDRQLFGVVGTQHLEGRGRPARLYRLQNREAVQEVLREQQRALTDDPELIERAAQPLPLPAVHVSDLSPVEDLLVTLSWAETQIPRAAEQEPEEQRVLAEMLEQAADEVLAAPEGLLDTDALDRARLVQAFASLLKTRAGRASTGLIERKSTSPTEATQAGDAANARLRSLHHKLLACSTFFTHSSQGGTDCDRARQLSTSLLGVTAGVEATALADIEEAAKVQWDTHGGKPERVLAAIRSSDFDFMNEAMIYSPPTGPGLALRPITLRAETLHRAGEYRQALQASYGGLHWLIKHAPSNSEEELANILTSQIETPLAEHAVAVLAIHVPVIRRCEHISAEGKRRLMDQCRRLAEAYVLRSDHTPVTYPRTHAFAAQMFLALKELDDPGDTALIAALYDLMKSARLDASRSRAANLAGVQRLLLRDDVTRPSDDRSRATDELMAVAFLVSSICALDPFVVKLRDQDPASICRIWPAPDGHALIPMHAPHHHRNEVIERLPDRDRSRKVTQLFVDSDRHLGAPCTTRDCEWRSFHAFTLEEAIHDLARMNGLANFYPSSDAAEVTDLVYSAITHEKASNVRHRPRSRSVDEALLQDVARTLAAVSTKSQSFNRLLKTLWDLARRVGQTPPLAVVGPGQRMPTEFLSGFGESTWQHYPLGDATDAWVWAPKWAAPLLPNHRIAGVVVNFDADEPEARLEKTVHRVRDWHLPTMVLSGSFQALTRATALGAAPLLEADAEVAMSFIGKFLEDRAVTGDSDTSRMTPVAS
jgi:hypothetical protein